MKFRANLKTSTSLIDLTPLVDVIFLMLIFFMVTSDILPLKSLNIDNPALPADAQPLTTQILVVMDAQNVIFVGSKKAIVEMSSLRESVQKEMQKIQKHYPGSAPTIVLSVDRQVEYGVFLRLFNELQGLTNRLRLVFKSDYST
ncbi:putative biopolymer transport protein exbD [Chlamydiales bacterium STE3]|nr:putative biopolymer transport protein exbD [Chlamydiales bacterium STE3]